MSDDQLGQLFALSAAITWAGALVLFKRSGERIAPLALNLFKNTVGLLLLAATMVVLTSLGRDNPGALLTHPIGDLCILMFSGIIGIAIADTMFFHGLNLIGVGLVSVVDCTYTPFAIVFSWLLLAEHLTIWHYAGAALIVAGVFTATRHRLPDNRTRGQIVFGILLTMGAIATMAFGIVLVKPLLEQRDMPLFAVTALRLAAGTAFLALFALIGRDWRRHWTVFRPSPTWKVAIPGSFLGAYLSLVFWVAGFKYTYAALAAVLNQTSVIFAAILAAVFLKEQFGPRKIAALVLAVVGVLIVRLSG